MGLLRRKSERKNYRGRSSPSRTPSPVTSEANDEGDDGRLEVELQEELPEMRNRKRPALRRIEESKRVALRRAESDLMFVGDTGIEGHMFDSLEEAVSALFDLIDLDGGGTIDEEEFMHFCADMAARQPLGDPYDLWAALDMHDQGEVTLADLTRICKGEVSALYAVFNRGTLSASMFILSSLFWVASCFSVEQQWCSETNETCIGWYMNFMAGVFSLIASVIALHFFFEIELQNAQGRLHKVKLVLENALKTIFPSRLDDEILECRKPSKSRANSARSDRSALTRDRHRYHASSDSNGMENSNPIRLQRLGALRRVTSTTSSSRS